MKPASPSRIPAASSTATAAFELAQSLQRRFADRLEQLSRALNTEQVFTPVEWLRDHGRHGGGLRLETADGPMLGRGSINVSQVHYDDEPERQLGSANALSTIMHPAHPRAPSVHIHISWTEQKNGTGYWRIMADLNPAIEHPPATARFMAALHRAAPAWFERAREQGDRYFWIPALGRHRGVAHFYLEGHATDDAEADATLARRVGETAIDTYTDILGDALRHAPAATPENRAAQTAYHTLYFFQVLTLDRGTTTGLLAHDQNDIGILGSLPPRVDRALLASWLDRMQPPQDALLEALLSALPDQPLCTVDTETKRRLARAVRAHYHAHPEALAMQAGVDITPPTIENHRKAG